MAKKASILVNLLNLSPGKVRALLAAFPEFDEILAAGAADLQRVTGLGSQDIEALIRMRESEALSQELALIAKNKITCVDIYDSHYPGLLKEIANPPLVLYVWGDGQALSGTLFAIVGSRIPTVYGLTLAEDFAFRLSSLGVVIVSGLARGIDAAAHRGALNAGKTVAVLGSGLGNIYPRDNHMLAGEIAASGAVITEFPMGIPPLKENFPRRNRIISGLCRGVLVVEAASRSGALITAHCAVEQNRDVFAVPGNVDSPLSRGTHALIKEGAKLVESLTDIVEELPIELPAQSAGPCVPGVALDQFEQEVFKVVNSCRGTFFEDIIKQSGLNLATVAKAILNLQLKHVIREIKPNCFVRAGTSQGGVQ